MPEHDAPIELRAIGGECSYFKSSYPEERVHDLMGATIPAVTCVNVGITGTAIFI